MTSTPVTNFDAASDMDEATSGAARRLLRAVADTKLLLGYHYGEWTFGTPELEAAVANCSLSQSELGHLRLLDGVLKKSWGDDPDTVLAERDAAEFANVACLDGDLPDWPACIAMNAVVDDAVTYLLHAMMDSTFRPLRQSVAKMVDEERYHVHHGRGWVRAWASRGATEREALASRLGAALASVEAWFGPAGEAEDQALVAAGIKAASNREVFASFKADLTALVAELEVTLPESPGADFSTWSPQTRRIEEGGPRPGILAHLRGDRNDIFKRS